MDEKIIESLSNKSFKLDKRPVINKIYIMSGSAQSDGNLETATRTYGFIYAEKNGFLNEATRFDPVYRYGKKFTKFKLDFNIFTHTKDEDTKAVEGTFDAIVKNIKRADILEAINGFYGLEIYHGEE